jgi:hypothetical protein
MSIKQILLVPCPLANVGVVSSRTFNVTASASECSVSARLPALTLSALWLLQLARSRWMEDNSPAHNLVNASLPIRESEILVALDPIERLSHS